MSPPDLRSSRSGMVNSSKSMGSSIWGSCLWEREKPSQRLINVAMRWWALECGAKEGAKLKDQALDSPVVLPPDPHQWPPAAGGDVKGEITDASDWNEFLCWQAERLGGRGRAKNKQSSSAPWALCHHDMTTVSNQTLEKEGYNVLCLPQIEKDFNSKRNADCLCFSPWLSVALRVHFKPLTKVSALHNSFCRLRPGSPCCRCWSFAVQLCVLTFLSGCLYFPVCLLRLDKVL